MTHPTANLRRDCLRRIGAGAAAIASAGLSLRAFAAPLVKVRERGTLVDPDGPLGGERGAAREVLQREHVDDRQVVVAGEADRAVLHGQRDIPAWLHDDIDRSLDTPH